MKLKVPQYKVYGTLLLYFRSQSLLLTKLYQIMLRYRNKKRIKTH